MLGILDSGVGGLTVLQAFRRQFPQEDFFYFADQANSPLGTRPAPVLAQLFQQYVDRLQAAGVAGIAMGSNTLCAISREHGWPAAQVPIIDMIAPAVQAVIASGAQNIGVLATQATVVSGVYGNAIRYALPQARVQEVAASELVPCVEAGSVAGKEVEAILTRAQAEFAGELDLLVLGCTHFPWLNNTLSHVFGLTVQLVDPALAMVSQTIALMQNEGANGKVIFQTTGDPYLFRQQIECLIGPLNKWDTVTQAEAVTLPA